MYKISLDWVRERTIQTKRLPPVSEVSENFLVSVTNPYGRILEFLDRSHYFFSN
jgi:hypothetical protein